MYYTKKLLRLLDTGQILATFGNGRLYNWYAVNTGRLAPVGWHVPTNAEFTTLTNFLGGGSVAGGPLKSTRTGLTPGWNSPNTGATNASGFNGFSGGYRLENGEFLRGNQFALFWSSTEYNANEAWQVFIRYDTVSLTISFNSKKRGKSVRCIIDNPSNWSPGMMVSDIDGNQYTTVKIGTQVWMGSNLKTTRYNDGTMIPFAGVNGINFSNAEWDALTTPGQCTYNNAAIAEYTELWPAV